MNMQSHIKNVSRTAMYHLYNISKIKRYLGQSSTEQIIHALVTYRMDYCNSVLVGQSTSALAPLQRVQNAAARLLTNGRKFDHITPALMQLHWLPVKHRLIFKVCLLIFKCLHESAPSYLSDLLDVRIPGRFTRSALDSSRLSCPKTRLSSAGERMFSVAGPRLWNQLGVRLRECRNVESFKTGLKTHLFKQAFLAS